MKRNIIIISVLTVLIVGIIASCSFITPAPDFELYFHTIGYQVNNTTTALYQDTMMVVNTGQVDMYVVDIDYDYMHDGTVIYNYDNNADDFKFLCEAISDSQQAAGDSSYVIIYSYDFAFPSEVWDAMSTNNWPEVNLRVYITADDAYGYGKSTTKYVDCKIYNTGLTK